MSRTDSYRILAGTDHETTVHVYDSERRGPTTMVTGGVHGNEPAGYRAAGRIADWEVETGELVVVPRCNQVAIARDSRYDDDGDLNRKFPPRGGDPETRLARALWDEVERHDPDWMFDLHSARGIYRSDGSVGQALFPTWTSPARAYGENAVSDLNREFSLSGEMAYLMGNTLDADRKMLMHRVAGLLDSPGFICEATRKGTTTSEQVAWHLYVVEHVMNQYGQRRGTAASFEFDAGLPWLSDHWRPFDVDSHYSHPAVVAPALSYRGSDPAHVRIRDLTGSSFRARIEEWPYLDGDHAHEQTGYLVADPGVYSTDGGREIRVGRNHVDHEWHDVSFDGRFSTTPALFATPQSVDGPDPVVARIRDASPAGFEYRLQEQDAGRDHEYHTTEMVSWMAFEPGRGTVDGRRYEAKTVTADDDWRHVSFTRSYDSPVFLADVMSYEGWNAVGVRWKDLSPSGVDLFVEEERSADRETTHADETVSYVVLER